MTSRNVEIVVKGELGHRLQSALEGVAVTVTGGDTHLRVVTRDASALYGMLEHLETLGFELLAVHALDQAPPT